MKIPKAQKDSDVISAILCFWDICVLKAARKMLVRSTPKQTKASTFNDNSSAIQGGGLSLSLSPSSLMI